MLNTKQFQLRAQCPACKSTAFDVLVTVPYKDQHVKHYLDRFYAGRVDHNLLAQANWTICECRVCGLLYQKEIPGESLMRELYGSWIDPQETYLSHQINDDLDLFNRYAQEISTLISHFGRPPSELRFFDFGMGWGKWALMAKGYGCASFGSELSQDRIDHAVSNGISVVGWDQLPGQDFNFINTEQVFEHIAEPLETLKHLKKSLTRGGILKISVPIARDIQTRLKVLDWKAPLESKNSLDPLAPLEHINLYSRRSILKMAELCDMEEVTMPLSRQYMFVNNWSSYRNVCRNLLLPVYRCVLKRQNYILLRHKHDS